MCKKGQPCRSKLSEERSADSTFFLAVPKIAHTNFLGHSLSPTPSVTLGIGPGPMPSYFLNLSRRRTRVDKPFSARGFSMKISTEPIPVYFFIARIKTGFYLIVHVLRSKIKSKDSKFCENVCSPPIPSDESIPLKNRGAV